MPKFKRIMPWLLLAVMFGLGFMLGTQSTFVAADVSSQERDVLFAPFWETWDMLHRDYVEPLDDDALMEAALIGMIESLGDEHTFYMDADTFDIVNTGLEGEFEGIGATVRQNQETGALVIVNTLPDAPAEKAGLLGGDAVVQVDGEDVTGLPQSAIISLIRGPEGTAVSLGIMRPGESSMMIINVTRARIELESLEVEELEDDLLYIRLSQFGADTTIDLRQALLDYDAENRAGLVLDFRGNPGGFLSTAVGVASEFMADGLILKERFRSSERDYTATGDASAPTVPLVILVDEGSASASELVAGAFQDTGRATILGTLTFGKGSVQSWQTLSNGGGVRVTIARWYTPDDRTIHETGLVPDIEVTLDPELPEEDLQLQAAIELLLEEIGETAAVDSQP
ncbi:S41 family peptidase [Chloroflexota bacterium]